MGTDAIILCRRTKHYCDIDRMHNFEDNRNGRWDDTLQEGTSAQEAIEIGQYNMTHPEEVIHNNPCMTTIGIQFLKTLNPGDHVQMIDNISDEAMKLYDNPEWEEWESKTGKCK